MTDAMPFERMTIEERQMVLKTLARSLQLSASMARQDGDPVWKLMQELGDRLEESREQVALDADGGRHVIRKAVELLSAFERQRPRGSIH